MSAASEKQRLPAARPSIRFMRASTVPTGVGQPLRHGERTPISVVLPLASIVSKVLIVLLLATAPMAALAQEAPVRSAWRLFVSECKYVTEFADWLSVDLGHEVIGGHAPLYADEYVMGVMGAWPHYNLDTRVRVGPYETQFLLLRTEMME